MMARKPPGKGRSTAGRSGSGRPSGRSRPPGRRPGAEGQKRQESKRPAKRSQASKGREPKRQGPVSRDPKRETAKAPRVTGAAVRTRQLGPKGGAPVAAPRARTARPTPARPETAPPAEPDRRSLVPARRVRRPAAPTSRGLWLYGRHAVEAALRNPSRSCHRLLATPEARARLGAAARRPGLEVVTVEREELERRFGPDAVHQGLALSVAPLPRPGLEDACAPGPGRNLVLVLDQITDPHNLGAILRSAAAFEARAAVVPERNSAKLGGAAAKAAAGAADVVPVVEVTNLARALEELAELGYWRVALDGEAEATIDQVPDAENLALVLGAEGTGLRRLMHESCDFSARLPIAPAMESLNVSVACGIALYALARRHM